MPVSHTPKGTLIIWKRRDGALSLRLGRMSSKAIAEKRATAGGSLNSKSIKHQWELLIGAKQRYEELVNG